MSVESFVSLITGPVVTGLVLIAIGARFIAQARKMASIRRRVLRRDASYETGELWANRIGGMILVIAGLTRILGVW
jgi:xanthine/uracil permease